MNRKFENIKQFHKDRSKMPYEEKFEIVIRLQEINFEFSKHKKNKNILKPWNRKEIGLI